jgi:xanthine dehydrogenase accessory factor
MESIDVAVARCLRDWRSADKSAILVTVVRTWGSSPRPIGSIMALAADGTVVGSVSGGCIEDDLIARFMRLKADGRLPPDGQSDVLYFPDCPPELIKYGVTADEAHRFGLPCGGTMELLVEYNPDSQALIALVALIEKGRLVQRNVRLDDGDVQLTDGTGCTAIGIVGDEVVNVFGPQYRMLIIGAGHLAECLATMAVFCGFDVVVCDPREEYRGSWAVPRVEISSAMPDDMVLAMKPDRRTCVVALTHDPKLDDLALMEALKSDAFYVGAIGSRLNNQMRRERLVEHFGHSLAEVGRLRGPVGVYIGSKTPPEIAVSIMAEILACKNAIELPSSLNISSSKAKQETMTDDQRMLICGLGDSQYS